MAKRKAGKLEAGKMETQLKQAAEMEMPLKHSSLAIKVFANPGLLQLLIKFLNIEDETEVLLVNRLFRQTCDKSGPSSDFVRIYSRTNLRMNRHSNVSFSMNCLTEYAENRLSQDEFSFLSKFPRLRHVQLVACMEDRVELSTFSKYFQNPSLLESLRIDGPIHVEQTAFGFPNLKRIHLHASHSVKWSNSLGALGPLLQQCPLTCVVLSGPIGGNQLTSLLTNLPKTVVELQLFNCQYLFGNKFDFSVLVTNPLPNLRKVVCTKSGKFHENMDAVEKKLFALGVEFVFQEDGCPIM